MQTTHLQISGMTCGNCVRHVEKALRGVPGVSTTEVSIGSATIVHGDPASLASLIAAVVAAGYDADAK